jgi:hypothetical protein
VSRQRSSTTTSSLKVYIPLGILVIVSSVVSTIVLGGTLLVFALPEAQRVQRRRRCDLGAVVTAVHLLVAIFGSVCVACKKGVGGLGASCACCVLSESEGGEAGDPGKDGGCGTHSE